jgi:hypothetical protein
MKPPGDGSSEPHFEVAVDPDKVRIDAFLVQGKSVSFWQAKHAEVLRPGSVDGFYSYSEVRRRWYNPNRWVFTLMFRLRLMFDDRPRSRSASRSLTAFAGLLAGRKHSASRVEWLDHLAGEPGHRSQVFAALGFVVAAVRFRIEDAADLAWVPVDAVLKSRFLSSIFITVPVLAVVLAIVHHDGRYGLVLSIQDPFCTGAITWGTIFGLRKWRRVKPPEHRPRRVEE